MSRIRPGRLFLALMLLLGFYIAWQRLDEQQVPALEIASTGLLFIFLLAAFFLILLGAGKLLGKLFGRDD